MARLTQRTLALAFGLAVATSTVGCEPPRRVASPAEVEQLGTKQYPAHRPQDVRRAVVTALKLQGYEVVTESPRVRTAPKAIAIHAVGGGGRAIGFDETIAWDVDVEPSARGAIVRAQIRGQINGQPMKGLFYDYVERNCKALFADLDQSLAH